METEPLEEILNKAITKRQKNDAADSTSNTCSENDKACSNHEEHISHNEDYGLCIKIISMDFTDEFPGLLHMPVVQVYIVDGSQGSLLQKTDPLRRVTSFYEGEHIAHILPMMTQPFNIIQNKSIYCQWNEDLIFNESVNHIFNSSIETLFFFEVRDFLMQSKSKYISKKSNQDWRTIAWGFLKPVKKNGSLHIGAPLKLQLWKPRKYNKVSIADIFSWWKSGARRRYNSTLHVLLSCVNIDNDPPTALRSMIPTQREEGKITATTKLPSNASIESSIVTEKKQQRIGKCSIPNRITKKLPAFNDGCSVVKFSNDGTKLAGATSKYLLIFELNKLDLMFSMTGHHNLIYDVDWSFNDTYVASSSSDSSVRIWNIDSGGTNDVISHPSFVYCVRFLPGSDSTIVSGCYDCSLRVWSKVSTSWSLNQELEGHLGFINALTFSTDSKNLFSGDEQGSIIVWSVVNSQLKIITKYKFQELHGKIINHLTFYGCSLFVQTRDSLIRKIAIPEGFVVETYSGLVNERKQMRGCLSSCGSYLISGSENGNIYVWNTVTGLLETKLTTGLEVPLSCVDFHPYDNVIVVSSYVQETPIILMYCDKRQTSEESAFRRRESLEQPFKDQSEGILTKLDVILKMAVSSQKSQSVKYQEVLSKEYSASGHHVNELNSSKISSSCSLPPFSVDSSTTVNTSSRQPNRKPTARQRRHLRCSKDFRS